MNSEAAAMAAASCLLVGRCRVEVASREVSGPSTPRLRRITPKSMAVLRLLAAGGGQVLSREALLAGAWPDSTPTDDVLTQAITQLRKAFAAADSSEPYIETIARGGYRLLVSVQVLAPESEPGQDEATSPVAGITTSSIPEPGQEPSPEPAVRGQAAPPGAGPRQQWRRWRRRLLAVLALLLLSTIALLAWLLWQQRQLPREASVSVSGQRPYRLLTSSLEAETHPALSPSGELLAYTTTGADGHSRIMVRKRFANSPAHVLSAPPADAHDRLASWSPDGSQLAFARFHTDGRCQLMLAPANGEQLARPLLDCSDTELLSFEFTADGRALVLGSFSAGGVSAGISLFHIQERRWQALDYPRQPGDLDYNPRISPDGRWLVFARNPQLGRLYRMPAGGGPLQALDPGLLQLRGLTWLNDSRHIVAGRRIGMQNRLQRLDTEQPGVWQDLGVDDGQLPAAARQAPLLVFMQRRSQTSLFRLDSGQAPVAVYPSVGHELAPAVSVDGRQLIMFSDRNGVPAAWLGSADGRGSPRLVVGLEPDTRQQPVWDADSRHALVIGLDGQQRGVVNEVSTSGAVVPLPAPVNDALQAAYTNDPGQLLVLDRGDDDRGRLRLFDRDRSPWRQLAQLDGVSQMQWDRRGQRVLFTRFDRPGLFAWSAGSAVTTVVNERWPTRWRYRSWQLGPDDAIWYSHVSAACGNALRLLNPGQAALPASVAHSRCLQPLVTASMSGFASLGQGAALMAVAQSEGGDIGLLRFPDTAYGQLSASGKLLIP